MKKTISFVIPIYNEEEVIPELIKQLKGFIDSYSKYNFEVILVENGSSDSSFSLLKKYAQKDRRFKILQLVKNLGADGGIAAGLKYAKGEAVVTLMADLQEPFHLIKAFTKKWEEGYEIVNGVVRGRTAGFLNNLVARSYYKLINLLTGNMIPENVSDCKLMDKKVYQVINQMEEQNKFLRGLTVWTGFKHTGIPFDRKKRFAGKPKATFVGNLKTALSGILSYSYVPLHLVAIMGLIITTISFVLVIFYLARYFVYGRQTPGVSTIILSLFFLFGMLFFVLGIISEYIVRIYDEVKKRPNFIVRSKTNL